MTVITGHVPTFYQLLLNTGLVSSIGYSLWFVVTFWTCLETL